MGVTTQDLLVAFLEGKEEDIVNEATRRLRKSDSEHYREMETIDLRPRVAELYEAIMPSVIENNREYVEEFLAEVGLRRLRQGYGLRELQYSVNNLDTVIWEAASAEFAQYGSDAFEALNRLSDAIGWAKDRLALVCLDETLATEAKLRELDDLFNDYLSKRKEV